MTGPRPEKKKPNLITRAFQWVDQKIKDSDTMQDVMNMSQRDMMLSALMIPGGGAAKAATAESRTASAAPRLLSSLSAAERASLDAEMTASQEVLPASPTWKMPSWVEKVTSDAEFGKWQDKMDEAVETTSSVVDKMVKDGMNAYKAEMEAIGVEEKVGRGVRIHDPEQFIDHPEIGSEGLDEAWTMFKNRPLSSWFKQANYKELRKVVSGDILRAAQDGTGVANLNSAIPFAAGGAAVAASADPHDDVFNDMRANGIEGDTLPKRPQIVHPAVDRMIKRTGMSGLLDTLGILAKNAPLELGVEPGSGGGVGQMAYGSYWPSTTLQGKSDVMAIDTTLKAGPTSSRPSAPNVLAHEYGHFINPKDSEDGAEAFSRAILHLRDQDTTFNNSKVAALEMGISPLLPAMGSSGSALPSGSVKSKVDSLLRLPIYARHPLALARKKGAK